jgi:hypothetical protein
VRRWLVLLALAAAPVRGAELELAVEPQRLTVGDRAALTLTLRSSEELPQGAVGWPAWEGTLGTLEILAVGPLESVAGRDGERLLTQTLEVTSFEVGEAVVPPVGVRLALPDGENTLTTEEVRLEVVSVLPEDEAEPAPRPPAPPQPLAVGRRFWWLAGLLAAICVGAAVLLLRQARRGESPAVAAARLSPREELERALEALRNLADAASLYTGISMATRRYLGRILGFAAPESTTSEIQRALRGRRLHADLAARVGRLLTACDLVKFARRDASLDSGRERLAEIAGIADEVDAWLRPPEAVDEGASS